MALVSLVYISYAASGMTDDDLRAILATARTNNQRLDVTGMLLYRNGFFIQALEGEQEVVDTLFAKIVRDPRHKNVKLVYKNAINERSFGRWAMGFNRLEDASGEPLEGYSDFLKRPDESFFLNDNSRAKRLLESFRERSYF